MAQNSAIGMSALAAHLQAFEAGGVGLGGEEQAVVVAELGHVAVVVVGEEVGDRAAEVPEEAVGGRAVADGAPGEREQVGGRVVAAALLELLAHPRRPVVQAGLVAVDL